MSRIGKQPIELPSGVEVAVGQDNVVTVKGPRGSLTQVMHANMRIVVEDGTARVERPDDERFNRGLHGLTRSLLANMVVGVTDGFEKRLAIVGVGYRAAMKGKDLEVQVGYSHPVLVQQPDGIEFEVPTPIQIVVRGNDKAQVGETAELMPTWIETGVKHGNNLIAVLSEDGKQRVAQGYELSRTCVSGDLQWQERVLVVRSQAYVDTQQRHLEERLAKAQEGVLALTPPVGRGKRQISEEVALVNAAEAILSRHRVTGLLTYRFERQVEQEVKLVGRGRGGANRPQQVIERVRYQITAVERQEEAIATLVSTLGWRAYASNAPQKRLSLAQAVQEYRHEYHIEHSFGRLKGAPLSIAPLFVKRDDQVVGMTHLLSLALRVLTLMEFVVRRSLKQQETTLAGLYKDNPRRVTATPTAERLLLAFVPLTLTQVQMAEQTIRHVTTLSPLQEQILGLLGLPGDLYAALAHRIPQPSTSS